ncbi:MAG: glycosyltransferase family 4 protein [Verrucomicrobia bacterium]|nr:glycosyltransferase family 4 protein [Verrucomicrobiota bacterium]
MAAISHKWLGINWEISAASGWGIMAFNIALQAERDARLLPMPFFPVANPDWAPPGSRQLLANIIARERVGSGIRESEVGQPRHCPFPVLHALGNRLSSHDAAQRIVGNINVGATFFDETDLGAEAANTAKRFDLLLAGSTWNTDFLRQRGIANVRTWLQGVDLSIFRPSAPPRDQNGAFVVFSGGKLEYRKGQDIVIAAFRKFRARHSDAILLAAWHNHWPQSIQGMDCKGHVDGLPVASADGQLDIVAWLDRNGIAREACCSLGAAPNHVMAGIYSQADVAVFTNRCEGGTNLVAMECMASGLPTILSANSGHLDLLDQAHCYPLHKQGPVAPLPPIVIGTEHWGESDVDEVVEALERVYRDRAEAKLKGMAAANFMRDWSWERRYQEFLGHLATLGSA